MSHFTVMVIGEDPDYELAPFHEFECTGKDDEFVQNVDKMAEARESFAKSTETRYRDPEGNLHDPYSDRFYRAPTADEEASCVGSGFGNGISWSSRDWDDGLGYRAKVHFIPEGWEEVRVAPEDFAEWIEGAYGFKRVDGDDPVDLDKKHKYGWFRVKDGEVVEAFDRTNPNKQWDWYQIGGRWSGFLKLKPGAKGAYGQRSWMSEGTNDPMRCDQARKRDIDFDGMREEAASDAAAEWDKMSAARAAADAGDEWETWTSITSRLGYGDESRKLYNGQAAVVAMRAADSNPFVSIDSFLCSREEYVKRARNSAITTFAFLKDRQWAERGSMGWWGISLDEMDPEQWAEWFNQQIDALPDDALITCVDCHI